MKDPKNIILRSTLLFILGIVIAYIVWFLMGMKENGWLVLLIFAPNIIFFVYSGVLREAKYKDLISLVFAEAANEPIKVDFGSNTPSRQDGDFFGPIAPSREDIDQVGEQGVAILEQMLATYRLSEERPILMVIRLGEIYPRETTLGFIEKLSLYRSFKLIAFVDAENRLSAFMPVWAIRQTLSKPALGEEFLEIVRNPGRRNELTSYQNVIQESIKTGSKSLDALRIMNKKNLSAFVVTDEQNKIQGVVERDKVISQMMLKLAEKSTT